MPIFNVHGYGTPGMMILDPDNPPVHEPPQEPPPQDPPYTPPPAPPGPPPPTGPTPNQLWQMRNEKNGGDGEEFEDIPPPPPPDNDPLALPGTFTQPGTPQARPWHSPAYREDRVVGATGPGAPVDISGEGLSGQIGEELLRRLRRSSRF